jgi:murein DD-endopeptidase MepM/ murein hydrolase activator NlpD
MRRFAIVTLALAACAAAEPEAPAPAPPDASAVEAPAPAAPAAFLDPAIAPPPATGSTESVRVPALGPLSASPPPTRLSLDCAGAFFQGGVALCRTLPGARIWVDEMERGAADAQGWAVIGFDRDSRGDVVVHATPPGAAAIDASAVRQVYAVLPREFSVQRIDGLPPQTVTPTDPEVLARIRRETAIKNRGFASRAGAEGWLDGFVWPVEGRISGSWGNQRILNGEPRTPHYGVDIAMPEGTPIRAPAAGVVSLAEPDMHFEGGLVFIDHGQGLISMYLHMSRLDVAAGDQVAQGQVIGAVGARGRATGPHLCWRMKWRDRNLDPSLAILGLAQARMELAGATP